MNAARVSTVSGERIAQELKKLLYSPKPSVGFYLMRSISVPVAAIRRGAERVGTGDLNVRIDFRGNDELADLAGAFDRMTGDLAARQTELLEAHRLASIGQVASGVAHEINNPLGVILGYIRILQIGQNCFFCRT